MKLGILGSQTFVNFKLVEDYIARLEKDTTILTLEKVKGVHAVANWQAKKNSLKTVQILVDWEGEGKKAFFASAAKLIEESEEVTFFLDEYCSSSRKLVEDAYLAYKNVTIIKDDGSIEVVGTMFLDESEKLERTRRLSDGTEKVLEKPTPIEDDDIPF